MRIVKRYNYLGLEIAEPKDYISESKNAYALRDYIESICKKETAQHIIKDAGQKYT